MNLFSLRKARALFTAACVAALLLTGAAAPRSARAQDAQTQQTIRRNIHDRLPKMPAIDEIRKSPIAGLFELRVGRDIFYSDANGDYLLTGEMLDTRNRVNLTEARLDQVFKQDLAQLDWRNAVVWKKGKGQRRLVVFADPYCGYCKRLEQELQKLDNLTVYTFMVPVISEDSPAKIRDIWCAPDRVTAWRQWMLDNVSPPRAMGQCEAPLKANLQAYDHFQVHGTPGIFFEDGSRSPGLLPAAEIEQRLSGSGAAATR